MKADNWVGYLFIAACIGVAINTVMLFGLGEEIGGVRKQVLELKEDIQVQEGSNSCAISRDFTWYGTYSKEVTQCQ